MWSYYVVLFHLKKSAFSFSLQRASLLLPWVLTALEPPLSTELVRNGCNQYQNKTCISETLILLSFQGWANCGTHKCRLLMNLLQHNTTSTVALKHYTAIQNSMLKKQQLRASKYHSVPQSYTHYLKKC